MKSRGLQSRSRSLKGSKKPLRKKGRELKERLRGFAMSIINQEEKINSLREERSQLNSSEDHDAE
jgi:hypothetical protein